MAVNLDDPSTWPDDVTSLAKLADKMVESGSDQPDDVAAPAAAVAETTPAAPAAPAAETVPAAPAAPAAPVSESVDEKPILAADGVHTIPHRVLKETREGLRAAQQRAADLEAQLRSLSVTQAVAPASPSPAGAPQQLPADVKSLVEETRERWGDVVANQVEATYWLEQRTQQQQQLIEKLSGYIERQEQAAAHAARLEEEQMQDAIDASPTMRAWQTAEDGTWFDRAVEVNKVLMASDPKYAKASWHDRFAQLPLKVEALFGARVVPSVAPVVPEAFFVNPEASSVAGQKIKAALSAAPTSLSQIPSGTLPEKDEQGKLEDMSGAEMQAFMTKLAGDPAKLEAYLRRMS